MPPTSPSCSKKPTPTTLGTAPPSPTPSTASPPSRPPPIPSLEPTASGLVLHLAAWQGEATRRLEGNAPALPEEGDWPAVGEISETAWQSALERLDATHGRLLETLARLTDADLDRAGGSLSDRALGTGVTYRTMVVGVLQHAAYHSGQIVVLRKALE